MITQPNMQAMQDSRSLAQTRSRSVLEERSKKRKRFRLLEDGRPSHGPRGSFDLYCRHCSPPRSFLLLKSPSSSSPCPSSSSASPPPPPPSSFAKVCRASENVCCLVKGAIKPGASLVDSPSSCIALSPCVSSLRSRVGHHLSPVTLTLSRRVVNFVLVFLLVLNLNPLDSLWHSSASSLALAEEIRLVNDAGNNITKILNSFFDSGYDKRVRPNYGGMPAQVGVTMRIIGISSVSEVQMDFTSDFYFRQLWKDNRLSFNPTGGITELVVGAEVAEKIWVPDTFFANEKTASFHEATTPNTFLRIGSNGEVYRSIRLTVTSSCPMNLQYFPMDSQLCTIEIESYGYSMADIVYVWAKGKGSVGMAKGLELPQFKVVGHKQSFKIEMLSTGNYSRLVCEIQFERSMGYYLIQIYIPASLIVIISWVSFWLHRNATPARVALGVTTVLTMTTLMSSTNAALPKISYIKSIDVFLGTCFVMVFASLLEYATVGYLGKRIAMRKSRTQQLAKLAQEHRNRCAAAAAAAAAADAVVLGVRPPLMGMGPPPPPPPHPSSNSMVANQVNLAAQAQRTLDELNHENSGEPQMPLLSMPLAPQAPPGTPGLMCQSIDPLSATLHRPVKSIPLHQMDRYATLGTPRIVSHPSMASCPPSCLQAYNRPDVRVKMNATPILSGGDARKSFSKSSPYTAHHDSSLNGPASMAMSGGNVSGSTPLPPLAGPSLAGHPSPGLSMHTRQHIQQQQQQQQQQMHQLAQSQAQAENGGDGDSSSLAGAAGGGGGGMAGQFGCKNPNKLFGVSPSDIDKYSRVVFPVCFVCFNLMYWIIYLHISSQVTQDLVLAD